MRTDVLLPVFLIVQAGLVYFAASGERVPPTPALGRFPAALGQWKQVSDDKIAPDVAAQLGADQWISRYYSDQPNARLAGLFVAWFESQRGGARQPHSPKVCLPGAGWTPESTADVTIETTAGPITVTRMIVGNGAQRAVVLYWYQTPLRVVGGEWAAKFWLVVDALRSRRSDTALVRVMVWIGDDKREAALETARDFARTLFPVLKAELPR